MATQTNAVKSVMDTDIHAMLQDAEDYLNGELLRITEEWPSEREHQGESMLMPYLSYSKEHRYFYRIALANRNMLPVQKIFKYREYCRDFWLILVQFVDFSLS